LFWQLMGQGIDWMIAVALWVAGLPGAVGHIRAFGTGPLLLGTAALLLLCLLRSPLRLSGVVLAVVASIWAVTAPRPDVLVSADGQTAALRGGDGRLSLLHAGRDTFAVKEWLAADGDSRTSKDVSLHNGARCDPTGCIGRLKDGRLVSMALTAEAFAEDCARAAVVVSPREAPPVCAVALIDRQVWRSHGAVALRWTGDHFEQSAARPASYDRPWTRHWPNERTATPAPDATPRGQDLEADD
jgi:competence protein ComEC